MKTNRFLSLAIFLLPFSAFAADPACKVGNDITACFTDANFKAEVYEVIGKTISQPIMVADVEAVGAGLDHRDLFINEKDIENLDGIEYFTNLQALYARNNSLTSLDVSKNTKLKILALNGNLLTSLDVSKNTTLRILVLSDNPLTSIDVSENINLEDLEAENTSVKSLDISKNTKLGSLLITNMPITSLDVSKNTLLEQIAIEGTSIQSLDLSKNTELLKLIISNTPIKSLDISKSTKLEGIYATNTKLTELSVFSPNLDVLQADQSLIAKLDIRRCKNLTDLVIYDNLLTEIDLSKNTKLTRLDISRNNLEEIDLSNNTRLIRLSTQSNANLKEVDVSKNTALKHLAVSGINLDILTGLPASLEELVIWKSKIAGVLDLSKNNNLKTIIIDWTKISGLILPDNVSKLNSIAIGGHNRIASKSSITGLTADEVNSRPPCYSGTPCFDFTPSPMGTSDPVPSSYLAAGIDPQNAVINVTVSSGFMDGLLGKSGWDASEFLRDDIEDAVNQKLKGEFDFVFIILDTDRASENEFTAVNERNNPGGVTGIGHDLQNRSIMPKRKGRTYFAQKSGFANIALHEFLHQWAARLIFPDIGLGFAGHWGEMGILGSDDDWNVGACNAGGHLGGFKYARIVEENAGGVPGKTLYQAGNSDERKPDGSFKDPYTFYVTESSNGNGPSNNKMPYSDIELYVMGLKSVQDLRDENFTFDIYYDELSWHDDNSYFYASKKASYTIDDIIEQNGPRTPSYEDSQKEFKILTIIVSEEGKPSSVAQIVEDLYWLAGPCDSTYSSRYNDMYNFCQATYGEGKLIIGNISESERQDIQYALTFNSNGGTAVPAQSVSDGDYANKPKKPTKEGFKFIGWFSETLDRMWGFFVDYMTEDVELTAMWEEDDFEDPSSSSTPSSSSSTPSSSSGGIAPIRLTQIAGFNQATQIHNGINLQATNDARVEIFSLKGNTVSRQNFGSGVYNVALGHLPKGMYIVKVSFGSEKRILRVAVR